MVAGTTILVSRSASSPSRTGNGPSRAPPVLSADGRFVAFNSKATDLVSGVTDENLGADAFLYDRTTGIVTLLSRSALTPASTASWETWPESISADGDRIALVSLATDLVPGVSDANSRPDVFVYRRSTTSMSLVSRSSSSATTTGDGSSFSPRISGDGSRIAFQSEAMDMIPGGVPTLFYQIFLYDVPTGAMTLVSRSSSSATTGGHFESFQPRIDGDGSRIAFASDATDLLDGQMSMAFPPDLFLYDVGSSSLTLVSRSAASPREGVGAGGSFALSGEGDEVIFSSQLSADGRYITLLSSSADLVPGFTGSASGPFDHNAYLFDRTAGTTTLITGVEGSPTQGAFGTGSARISAGGRYVVFESSASNLIPGQQETWPSSDVFVWDRMTGTTQLVSHAAGSATQTGQGSSGAASISADGRYIAFQSFASDLVSGFIPSPTFPGAPNVYLHDRVTGLTQLVSRTAASATTGASGSLASLSEDGRFVGFQSSGNDLVPGQTGPAGIAQAYLFDRVLGTMTLVSHAAGAPATASNGTAFPPRISADGRLVSFASAATDLIPGQNGPAGQFLFNAFVHDRVTGATRLVSGAGGSSTQTGNDGSGAPLLSADGSVAAFASSASNLVEGDYLGTQDIFLSTTPAVGTDFFAAAPCRVLDTRSGPAPVSGNPRLVAVAGTCGIPATARAIVANLTAVSPTGNGNLAAHPGYLEPTGTSVVNFQTGRTRAASAILPLALNGTGTLSITPFVAGGGTVHVLLDVSGWFELPAPLRGSRKEP